MFQYDMIAVKVEHPDLPSYRPGIAISETQPSFRTTIKSVEEVEFERWG